MNNIDKWGEYGRELSPEEEEGYLADLCEHLREQQTLSNPEKNEDGVMTCEIVQDEVAAHAADIIEELWRRVQDLQYELKEVRAEFKP